MRAPVMRLEEVRRKDHLDGSVIEGTLLFDGEPMCSVLVHDTFDEERSHYVAFSEAANQTHEQLHQAIPEVVHTLSRVAEWMAIKGRRIQWASAGRVIAQLARVAESESLLTVARGDLLLQPDLSDLPAAPYYVLADDEDFGRNPNWSYSLTIVVPCEDAQSAEAIAQRMRRAAVHPPYSWDDPQLKNIRTIAGPFMPARSQMYSLLPTGAGGWLWQNWPEIPPPDPAIEVREVVTNPRKLTVGEFDVPDGNVVVKDPTYGDSYPEPHKSSVSVVPGRYRITAEIAHVHYEPDHVSMGERVIGLYVRNIDPKYDQVAYEIDDKCAVIPVDGGCVGVFAEATRQFTFGHDDPLKYYGLDAGGQWRGTREFEEQLKQIGTVYDDELGAAAQLEAMQATISCVGMVGDTGCVSESGMGDGQYYAMPARRDDGGIVGFAVPFLTEAFSLTRNLEQQPAGIERSPYYSTLIGRAESYLSTVRETYRLRHAEETATIGAVARLAAVLRSADAGDREPIDSLGDAELEYIKEQLTDLALQSTNAYESRGGELLRELTQQVESMRVQTIPVISFAL